MGDAQGFGAPYGGDRGGPPSYGGGYPGHPGPAYGQQSGRPPGQVPGTAHGQQGAPSHGAPRPPGHGQGYPRYGPPGSADQYPSAPPTGYVGGGSHAPDGGRPPLARPSERRTPSNGGSGPGAGQRPGGTGDPSQPYPGGPLALPDETSLYVYGPPPEGYTAVIPSVDPVDPRNRPEPRHNAAYTGGAAAPPARRLEWREVLGGLLTSPLRTMDRTRDHAYWWPALLVSAVGGVLALFANDAARDELTSTTLRTSVPAALFVVVLVPAFFTLLGVISHALAVQSGGNGSLAPFATLSTLVVWVVDAPRLVVSLFARDDNALVLILAVATFVLSGWLLTALMMRVHELAWPRALGCVGLQLLALLLVLKLPLG